MTAKCPYCGYQEEVDEDYVGQVGECSSCHRDYVIIEAYMSRHKAHNNATGVAICAFAGSLILLGAVCVMKCGLWKNAVDPFIKCFVEILDTQNETVLIKTVSDDGTEMLFPCNICGFDFLLQVFNSHKEALAFPYGVRCPHCHLINGSWRDTIEKFYGKPASPNGNKFESVICPHCNADVLVKRTNVYGDRIHHGISITCTNCGLQSIDPDRERSR